MLLLVAGPTQSGEDLVYQMVWDLLEEQGAPQARLRATELRHLPGVSKAGLVPTDADRFPAVAALAGAHRYLLARTHDMPTPAVLGMIRRGEVRHVCLTRDPAAAAEGVVRAAEARQLGRPDLGISVPGQARAKARLAAQSDRLTGWRTEGAELHFDEVLADMPGTLGRVAARLGLEPPSQALAARYGRFADRLARNGDGRPEEGYLATGIVTGTGVIRRRLPGPEGEEAEILSSFPPGHVEGHARIYHSGADCRITHTGSEGGRATWRAAIPPGPAGALWETGARLNLERPLRPGDGAGGQLVFGDRSETARVSGIDRLGDMRRVHLRLSGSVPAPAAGTALVIDGIALTVARGAGSDLSVHVLPRTAAGTTLSGWEPGRDVFIEREILPEARIPPPFR